MLLVFEIAIARCFCYFEDVIVHHNLFVFCFSSFFESFKRFVAAQCLGSHRHCFPQVAE